MSARQGPRPLSPLYSSGAGFTLVELVVGSSIMVLVLSGAYLVLQAALSAERALEGRGEALQSARVALALLSADFRSATPLSKDFELLGMDRTLDGREADNCDFATLHYAPARPGEGEFCEVSWFVDRSRRTGEPSLYRRRDPSPDGDPLGGGSREEIVTGLAGLRFEYTDGLFWYDSWGPPEGEMGGRAKPRSIIPAPNEEGMPEAVRITLSLEDPLDRRARASAPREPRLRTDEEERQPAGLVLQTVVRLELASRAAGMALDSRRGSGGESGSGGAGSGAAPAAEGGSP